MDVAYDHIQEKALTPPEEEEAANCDHQQRSADPNTEFQQAFQAVTASPWGSKLGGWFSQARKQGEILYQDLSKEAAEASEQATKGFTSLRDQVVSRTRGMSLDAEPDLEGSVPGEEPVPTIITTRSSERQGDPDKQHATATTVTEKPDSLPADIVKEAGSLVANLRSTAAAKLRDLQRAEDAADEALLKFGSNFRNFLRDAVTITAPDEGQAQSAEVLFKTQEPGTGKKIFHSTRLDAQLHAIHTNASSFTGVPQGDRWTEWEKSFDIENQTDAIAEDFEKYEELRRAMENLVPELVEYKAFWMRYYFLRKAIQEDERRRKEVLKGASADTTEEVAWDDDDDDDDEDKSITPNAGTYKQTSESTTTLSATAATDRLKPTESRRSEDENKSVADSDASYDLVSGATSRALGSPRESKKEVKAEDSEDDWE